MNNGRRLTKAEAERIEMRACGAGQMFARARPCIIVALDERYARWDDGLGREILDGTHDLASLATLVESRAIDPKPVSGRQELLENVVNRVTARLA